MPLRWWALAYSHVHIRVQLSPRADRDGHIKNDNNKLNTK